MPHASNEAFSLVEELAAELSEGRLKLPSLPEAVIRLRNELSSPSFSVERVSRIIATEPVFVGAILRVANSPSFLRSGNETMSLNVAISRIGARRVQMVATLFALRQLRNNVAFQPVKRLVAPEWQRAAQTAAACYLIAELCGAAEPDEALIVGLIHNIGRIYLFSRTQRYPGLFACPADVDEIVARWHTSIGRAIVESWNLPEETAEAVERQHELDGGHRPAMLNVLTVAMALATLLDPPPADAIEALQRRSDSERLELTATQLEDVVARRESLRESFGLG